MTSTEHHYVDLTTEWPTFTCDAPPGSECNTGCVEECDAWGEGLDCDHEQTRQLSYCFVKLWLEETDSGAHNSQPLVPIKTWWTGDYWAWRLLEGST